MIRNAALGAALAFALAAPAAPGPHAAAPAAARHARAFTLTEVLACIAIIGIIVAFTLPVMGRAKTSAMNAQSAAKLSGHARVFALYQQDFHDSFPALTFPEAEFSVIRCETGGFAITSRYFHVNALWNVGLADMYYNGNVRDTSFRSPWDPGGPCDECGVASSYYWSCSFLADPTYWNGETREVPPRQLRLTRPAEVRFPAQKSLLSAYLPHEPVVWEDPNMPVHAAFVDGHAQVFEFRAVVPSERSDGWEYADHRYGGHDAPARNRPALMHTPNGVRGIDVR
ncbi:MAG: type II secretion system protein [Phycisphaerae bacterium]|nr:type II secretion system protein [Phycisphaerae bacterium]